MKVTFTINNQLENDLLLLQANQWSQEVETIIKSIEERPLTLKCFSTEKIIVLPIEHFIRIFTSEKKVFVVAHLGEYTLNYRLYELETLLPRDFLHISNTEIINITYLSKLELTKTGIVNIYLKNNEQTSSSRRYLPKIKERLLC